MEKKKPKEEFFVKGDYVLFDPDESPEGKNIVYKVTSIVNHSLKIMPVKKYSEKKAVKDLDFAWGTTLFGNFSPEDFVLVDPKTRTILWRPK